MQLSLLQASRVVEERIARFAERAPRLLVAWSGGKDSTAALLAAYRCCRYKLYAAYVHLVGQTHATNTQAVLAVAKKLKMRITYVDMCGRRFRKPLERLPQAPAVIYIRSHGSFCRGFWEEAKQRGWPAPVERTAKHPGKRWCCQVFKTEPLSALAGLGFKWHVVGVKDTDSHYRKKLLEKLGELPVRSYGTQITLYPLRGLADADVWALIRGYSEEIYDIVKSQYEAWGYSPNCVICPLQSRKNFERTVMLMPTAWLEKTRRVLLLLQRHSCGESTKWTCKDLQWKLETIEKELKKRL